MVNAVVAVMAVMVAGCSFATMRVPHGSPPECTDSSLAPAVDIAVAIASPFVAYSILKANETVSSSSDEAGLRGFFRGFAAVAVSFPVWGIAGSSSIFGFVRAGRCSRAKRDYQQLMNAPPGPGSYAPPPIAPPATGAPPPIYPAPPPPITPR